MAGPPRPRGDGSDGDGSSQPRDGSESRQDSGNPVTPATNVLAAQENVAGQLELGTPGKASEAPADDGPGPGDGEGTDSPSEVANRERDRRLEELAADPAHNGAATPKSRREAAVGLAAEAQGDIPGPIRRAPLDNSDPAFQKDQGEFIDANGNHWDVKSPADIFPAGRNAGQPMPPHMRGRYDGEDFEQKLVDELAGGQNVIIDTKNLSPGALADLKSRVASHADWVGKVVFVK